MIARGFKSVIWVATVGGAALGCYMVSLRVATERAELARVEHQILSTRQQIRSLQTELGTRGRLSQLEEWNADVLALSAPASGQYLKDAFTLARLDGAAPRLEERSANVRMAAAEAAPAEPAPKARPSVPAIAEAVAAPPPPPPTAVVHQASFDPSAATAPRQPAAETPRAPAPRPAAAEAPRASATREAKSAAVPVRLAPPTDEPSRKLRTATAAPAKASPAQGGKAKAGGGK